MPAPRPSRSSFQTYLFIALVAVELLMSFTFLGYLHVQPISITFAYIPPILAGCLLGPVQATVLGAVFGLDLSDVTISLVCVVLSQLAWHVYHLPAVENFRLYVDQSVHDSQWDRRLYRA